MSDDLEYGSFMLRLWLVKRTKGEPNSLTWMGEIEHIQTSRSLRFHGFEDLLEFLEEQFFADDAGEYHTAKNHIVRG